MQERQASVDGVTRPLPEPFIVLATQNPIELEGTFALPEAQLDRFLLRIAVGYPSVESEHAIARRHQAQAEPLTQVPTISNADALLGLRDAVRVIRVADEVEAYLVSLVRATREHPDVRLGASPRSSVALYRAAQAWASLDGRAFVLPDDVRAVAHAVLGHRILLDLDRELRGASVASVVDAVLDEVPVPLTP
jgi:MoxR-like ATPase